MSPVAAPEPITLPLAQELEEVYRVHAPLVYRTAWGVLGSREDAEDVLQTIFLRILRRECPPDLQKNPKAYLYKAAVTASLDVLKARRRRPVLVDDIERLEGARQSGLGTQDSALEIHGAAARFDDDTHQRLYEAIAQLSSGAAEILILRYMQNKNIAGIAKGLGVSRTVIAVRLFRSRARLKRLLRAPLEMRP